LANGACADSVPAQSTNIVWFCFALACFAPNRCRDQPHKRPVVQPHGITLSFHREMADAGVKYVKAVECLIKDRDALLAFYDFPAEHWKHVRTTNVIESSFATVRHRTIRSKGCLSNKTALAMIFKLAEAAEKSRRRLKSSSV
jgi:hypothetical protein